MKSKEPIEWDIILPVVGPMILAVALLVALLRHYL